MLTPLDIGLLMGLLLAWAVLSVALSFRLLEFPDLTVEGSLPLGAAVFATLIKCGLSLPIAISCSIFSGAAAGALTGFIHIQFKLNKFLSGIIVTAILYSLSLRIMGASNIGLLKASNLFDVVEPLNNLLGSRLHLGSIALLISLLVCGSLLILFGLSTRRGVALRVAGPNPDYARALGINVPFNVIIGLAITNALASFCGVLLAMQQGFADISMGQGILILAIAAMTIGERLLPERGLPYQVFVLCAAILGSIVYQILLAYAVRVGLAATDLKLATAVMVLLIVAFRVSQTSDLLSDSH